MYEDTNIPCREIVKKKKKKKKIIRIIKQLSLKGYFKFDLQLFRP